MNQQIDIRWQQRFSNFSRAFLLLRDALDWDVKNLNQLEKEWVIQRFEYTFELAWKTLKDRMEYDGLEIDIVSPKSVVRHAYASKYLSDAQIWLRMIGDRNLMSHTYDFSKFEEVIKSLQKEYVPMLDVWHESLLADISSDD